MTKEIIDAIDNRTCLKVFYDPGERIIEPHTFGIGKDKQMLLRAYQIAGASASGEHENWKLFRLDKLVFVSSDGTPAMAPRHGYKRGDKVMKSAIIREV